MATVLVVDDEPIVRDVVSRYLERDGHRIVEAGDGDEARGLIEREAPNLVVLDVMLPGKTDGLALCRWIRSTSDLAVILLTARGEETDRIVGLELGADDYVTKPFSPRELATRVRTVLRRAQPAAPPPQRVEVGSLVVDAGRHEARKDGRLLSLTSREFDLLWFLASNANRVFSRDQLMARVWGYAAALDTGTVTVHVRRLREKLEDDPSQAGPDRDRLGCRLPAPRMTAFALALGVGVLAGCVGAVLVVRFLPTLRLQLGALALLAVCLPLGVVIASGLVMFDMHDAEILAIAIASAVFALAGAVLLSRWILRPLERLRVASARLARGDLSARASESGPRELVELSSSFNEMATNLEQLFDARRQLVAWASHDLRTPLASLRAMVEALEDGLAGPEEYLPAIREQLETLSLLIEDLFELARIDAGVLTLDVRDEPLSELVSTCLRALDAEARARNVHLEARLDPSDPAVRIAPDKVERVLLNLLTNALRHTPSDGAVSVVVQPNSDHVVVAVEDTGAGLAPGAAQRMFERFWRDDDSRARVSGGAGLGLAIAQGLVHAHGGTIWAENRGGGGARVAFTLPLAKTPAV